MFLYSMFPCLIHYYFIVAKQPARVYNHLLVRSVYVKGHRLFLRMLFGEVEYEVNI